MRPSVELSGETLSRVLYASQVAALLAVLPFVVFPLDGISSVALGVLFVALAVAGAVGLWRTTTDGDGGHHLGTAEDITYDPFADPGQAAKDRWEKAVRRLPGRDDED